MYSGIDDARFWDRAAKKYARDPIKIMPDMSKKATLNLWQQT